MGGKEFFDPIVGLVSEEAAPAKGKAGHDNPRRNHALSQRLPIRVEDWDPRAVRTVTTTRMAKGSSGDYAFGICCPVVPFFLKRLHHCRG